MTFIRKPLRKLVANSTSQEIGWVTYSKQSKATHALRKFRTDLKIVLISDIPPSGMAVSYNLDPSKRVLFDKYDAVVEYTLFGL
ncbi:MAG: hypothetical protein QOK23_2602 [Gammaproteobacteria bacterium]|nr:hypothetical protein [Gammaproteobacteria bacterium]